MQARTISSLFASSHSSALSSLESTNCNYQRVLSGQAISKKINVWVGFFVCVSVLFLLQQRKIQPQTPTLKLPLKSAEHHSHSHYSPSTSCLLTAELFLKSTVA